MKEEIVVTATGVASPIGFSPEEMWSALLDGKNGFRKNDKPFAWKNAPCLCAGIDYSKIPSSLNHARLRRSTPISLLAAVAGQQAFQRAFPDPNAVDRKKIALIVAVNNGCINYTRRFFDELVRSGASKVSPLLFPESVFNAPAAHLGAILGIQGVNYTLVGDSSSFLSAVAMGNDLLHSRNVDHVLVVGADELDWIIPYVYQLFRLVSPNNGREECIKPYSIQRNGFILGEGSAAVILERISTAEKRMSRPMAKVEYVDRGQFYHSKKDLPAQIRVVMERMISSSSGALDMLWSSANGTFVDDAEVKALESCEGTENAGTPIPVFPIKAMVGESFVASAALQMVGAIESLGQKKLPKLSCSRDSLLDESGKWTLKVQEEARTVSRAGILAVGLNHQVSTASVAKI